MNRFKVGDRIAVLSGKTGIIEAVMPRAKFVSPPELIEMDGNTQTRSPWQEDLVEIRWDTPILPRKRGMPRETHRYVPVGHLTKVRS